MTSTTMIPHSRPSIDQQEIRAVTEVLQSGHLAQGAVVERFERGMAAYLGLTGGVAVNSGTMALEVALRVLGIGPGDGRRGRPFSVWEPRRAWSILNRRRFRSMSI